jgi:hypothetical protein
VLVIASSDGDGSTEIGVDDVTVTSADPGTLADDGLEPESADVIVCPGALDRIELERLGDACRALHRGLRPGGQLLLRVDGKGRASAATIMVGLLRAGLEVVAAEDVENGRDLRLLRPLEYAEIVRFSGIGA